MTDAEKQAHDSFLTLFLEHQDALQSFARSLVPSRLDAQDVMQSAAAVLWAKFGELSSPDDFRRWAFGVVRFQALSYVRDKARNRHVLSGEVLDLIACDAEKHADVLTQQREALDVCLKKLPASQRALVTSAYTPGVQIQDLAKSSGRSAGAVYKELHRIRIQLLACAKNCMNKGQYA